MPCPSAQLSSGASSCHLLRSVVPTDQAPGLPYGTRPQAGCDNTPVQVPGVVLDATGKAFYY